jgi:hypothetical protein
MQNLKNMMKEMTHPPRIKYDTYSLQETVVSYQEETPKKLSRKDYQIMNNRN